MPEEDTFQAQPVTDLENAPPGSAKLSFYNREPLRLSFNEPTDADGIYRSIVVTYTSNEATPFQLRALTKYGEAKLCAYDYKQFDGFQSIEMPDGFFYGADDDIRGLIETMAEYLHDLLMFHRIDPKSCTFVPAEVGA